MAIMRRTLVLYGNSLILSSVGASLKVRPGVRVVTVDGTQPDAAMRLTALGAKFVLLDLATTVPEVATELCSRNPNLLVIGVDLQSDHTLLLSGGSARPLTTEELFWLIDN